MRYDPNQLLVAATTPHKEFLRVARGLSEIAIGDEATPPLNQAEPLPELVDQHEEETDGINPSFGD